MTPQECYYSVPCGGVCPSCQNITPEDQDTVIGILSTAPETDEACAEAAMQFLRNNYDDVEPAALIPHFRTMVVESDRPCLGNCVRGSVVSIDGGRLIMVTRQRGEQTCFVSLPVGHTGANQIFYGGIVGCRSRYTPCEDVAEVSELNRKWVEVSQSSHAKLSTWRMGDATAQMTDAQAALLGWTRVGDDRRNVTVVPTPDAVASAKTAIAMANLPTLDGTLVTIDGRFECVTTDRLEAARVPIYYAIRDGSSTFEALFQEGTRTRSNLKWHLEQMIKSGHIEVVR